jgi:hypothetical protein
MSEYPNIVIAVNTEGEGFILNPPLYLREIDVLEWAASCEEHAVEGVTTAPGLYRGALSVKYHEEDVEMSFEHVETLCDGREW